MKKRCKHLHKSKPKYINKSIKKLNAKIASKEEQMVTDKRKCFLYNSMLSHLETIYDEETLYSVLLSLGFTEEEINYEGLSLCDTDEDVMFDVRIEQEQEHNKAIDRMIEVKKEHEEAIDRIMDVERENTVFIDCDECGGCDCGIGNCCTKSKEPTETETEETCCGGKYIDEENCIDCDGCSCDGKCGEHPCKCDREEE